MKKVIKYTVESIEDFGYYHLEEKFTPEEFHKTIQNLVENEDIKVSKEDENNYYLELKNDDGYWDEFNIYVVEFITKNDYETCMEYDEGVGGGMRGYIYVVFDKIENSKNEQMIYEISWEEFKDSGALWWINRQLQLFGMSIVYEYDDKDNIVRGYPARNKFRGFSETIETKNFKKLTKFLKENIDNLSKDLKEDIDE